MSKNKKTLLLSANFEVVSLIAEKKVYKLLYKEYLYNNKCEVISSWDHEINWVNGKIKFPAILRLKHHIRKNFFNAHFSRKALVKRDKSTCQFCGKKLGPAQITVDHVLPRGQGGITSFTNCIVSCQICNNKKAMRTPEQAGMTLLKKPAHPSFLSNYEPCNSAEDWHEDWDNFLTREI